MAVPDGLENQGAEQWRLFAAVPLGDEVREEVARLQDELRRHGWPVRWVRPERAHITVKFFGDTEVDAVPKLMRLLEGVATKAAPTMLRTSGIGAFPSSSQPRVIWLGLSGNVRALEGLAASVQMVVGADSARFRPHITLGRVRDGAGTVTDFEVAARELQTNARDVPIGELVLIRSVLGQDGPTYSTLGRWRLGRPEPDEHG
jgi:2'-5' RNA ligase